MDKFYLQWFGFSAADFLGLVEQKLLTFRRSPVGKFTLDKRAFTCYIITMTNEKKHWTIVTKRGTHWAAQGDNEQDVRDNFFGVFVGVEIEEVLPVRLFTHEEEEELRREKLEHSCR